MKIGVDGTSILLVLATVTGCLVVASSLSDELTSDDVSPYSFIDACRWCYALGDAESCDICPLTSSSEEDNVPTKRDGDVDKRNACSCCIHSRFAGRCCLYCNFGLSSGKDKRFSDSDYYHPLLRGGFPDKRFSSDYYHPLLRGGFPDKRFSDSDYYHPLLRGGFPKKSVYYNPMFRGGYPKKSVNSWTSVYHPFMRGGFQPVGK